MNHPKHILIVGGGLAGAFAALECTQRGHRVTLADNGDPHSASRTAAGLFNVVTGRLAALTWQAGLLLQTLRDSVSGPGLENAAAQLHDMPIYRPFRTPGEANDWSAKASEPRFGGVVSLVDQPRMSEVLHNPYGGIDILPCGWTDAGQLIEAIIQFCATNGLINKSLEFDHVLLDPASGTVEWNEGNVQYDAVIFAEGVGIAANPWFGWVPIQPLKGQILELSIPDFEPGFVLSRKIYLIPRGEGRFVCGSTYEKHYTHVQPDPEGEAEILGHLGESLRLPTEVLGSSAALRPTSPNRRPVIGAHPQFPRLFLINGMGTKGLLQAPWAAVQTADLIEGKIFAPEKEAGIQRFFKKFYHIK